LQIDSNDPDSAANPRYIAVRLVVNDTVICYCPLGDLDLSGDVGPLDVVIAINFVFRFGPVPPLSAQCPFNLADFDHGGTIDILDVVRLINYVFRAGPPPPDPCD
jgi:hypothetical protein